MGKLAVILLHVDNLIYFLAGCAVMTFGILGLVDPSLLVDILSYIPAVEQLALVMDISSVAFGPSIYMTTIGAVAIVLSIIGGVGIGGGKLKRRHSLVVVYGLLSLLFMLFDIALIMFYAIDPYFIQANVEQSMKKTLEAGFEPVKIDGATITLPANGSANAWVRMQFEQSCCGVSNYTDYSSFNWKNNFTIGTTPVTDALVPPSCCVMIYQRQIPDNVNHFSFSNLQQCMTAPPIYTNNVGCSTYVMQQITRYNFIYVCVAAGMTALQAIIIALVMGALSEPLTKIGIV